jgi:putative SOS response-associated peptidase YedK
LFLGRIEEREELLSRTPPSPDQAAGYFAFTARRACFFLMPAPGVPTAWLGREPADTAELKALLAPYPSGDLICWPVSARVGSVKNNDPSLIEPVAGAPLSL